MRLSTFGGAVAIGLVIRASAQSDTTFAYTDPNTGIEFQRFFDNTDIAAGYSFGIALPENVTTDFIGQLVTPMNSSTGWGGISFGASMVNSLLLTAWPNGKNIMTSFREATAYATPDVWSGSPVTATPIVNGTFINSTHLSYTFLCSGCIIGGGTTFEASFTSYVFGYAVSGSAPTDPTDSSTAFPYHYDGYGNFGVELSSAQSPNYETWASWASVSATNSSSSSSSNTTTSTGTSSSSNSTTNLAPTSNTTYDVIVCGGGPAGIIVAERLAETGVSVLLLERGPASTVEFGSTTILPWNDTLTPYDIPALGSSLTTMPDISEFCTDTASTAGCLLGGSSSVNAMNFIHPQQRDFNDKWPAGWMWPDVTAAADRLYARNPGTTLPSADGLHYDQSAFDIVSGFLTTQGWSQVDSIQSPNDKTMVFSQPAWSILNDKRAGPVRTYLPIAATLPNFTLKLNTKVANVLRTGSTITGVLTTDDNGNSEIININAGGKVILSAGALSTPRILWNSGIGYADALDTVQSGTTGVVLPDESDWISLPVGHNLKDHSQYVLQFDAKNNFTAVDWAVIPTDPPMPYQVLYNASSGVLSQAVQRLHMWTSTNDTLDGETRFFQGTASALKSGIVTIKAFLTHGTTSTGVLGITSTGATIVETGPWMNTAADRAAMTNFLQWLLNSTSTANSTISYAGGSIDASTLIDTHITGDHWTGSAKMGIDDGRQNNGTSVVDLNTKVYGTDNLFVVDASIHPDLPTGNTQAIIMVVAEQAAAKIAAYQVTNSSTTTTLPTAPYGNSTVAATTKSKCSSIFPTSTNLASSTLATVAVPTASVSPITSVIASATGSSGGVTGGVTGSTDGTILGIIDMIVELIEDYLQ